MRSNPGQGTFTCEFTTVQVGEHNIEIVLGNESLNVTPTFYTYDTSKIRVGQIPPGYTGNPVDFDGEFRKKNPMKSMLDETFNSYLE